MKKTVLLIIVAVCFFVFQSNVYADTTSMGRSELTLFAEIPMVALPTRIPQPIEEAPAAISVITAKEIESSPYIDVTDLFRSQPGLSVMKLSGVTTGVAVRGFNTKYSSSKLAVNVDGRSVFSPLTQGVYWIDQGILLDDIKRIEIMRGPNSVLYGFNAFSGIISIVTKDPDETKGFFSRATIGDDKTQQYVGRVSDRIGDFSYRLSYARDNSQGLGLDEGVQYVDGSRLNTVNLKTKYEISDDKTVQFMAGTKEGNRGAQPIATGMTEYVRNDYQAVNYSQQLDNDSDFELQVARTSWVENRDNNADTSNLKYVQYDVDGQHSFKFNDMNNIVWGFNWRRNEARHYLLRAPNNMYHDTILRVFLQDQIALTDAFTYYFGVDWEQNNYTGSDWSVRQTAMYKIAPGHVLRATYARAFHAHSFVEYHFWVGAGVVAQGNQNLERESIDSYELGYRGNILDNKLNYDVQLFYNDVRDVRNAYSNSAPFSPANPMTEFDNGNRGYIRGVELAADYRPYRWLKAYANYTYLDVDDKKEVYAEGDPKHQFNIGATLLMEENYLPDYLDIRLGYVGSYKTKDVDTPSDPKIKIEEYIKLDAKIAKRFMDDAMELSLIGLNLWDDRHFEHANNVTVDREILASLKYEF